MKFENIGFVGSWTLNSLVFNESEKIWYCVGTENNVGTMKNTAMTPWTNEGSLGGWTLKMLTFDNNGDMWCVGTAGNVGKWNKSKKGWDDQDIKNWTLKMIAFDHENSMWCVGTEGNVAKWVNNKWKDYSFGGWTLDWIAFRKQDPGEVFCVGTLHNLGLYQFDIDTMGSEDNNWSLKSLTFSRDGKKAYAVGTDGNVGIADIKSVK